MHFLIILLSIFINFKVYSWEYRRPVPYIPHLKTPDQIDDVVGVNIVYQLHKTLFQMDENDIPMPLLVRKFKVENQGLTYIFELKNISFFHGKPLTPEDVFYTLKNALNNKINNYAKLKNIKSFKKTGTHTLKINLHRQNSRFIYDLTNSRLVILDAQNPLSGLGRFKLVKKNAKEILLKDKEQNVIRFILMNKEEAVTAFKKGDVDDLIFYSLNSRETESLKLKNILKIRKYFPRIHGWYFNEKLLGFQERKNAISYLNIKKIKKNCYQNERKSDSLIPQGYMGYEDFELTRVEKPQCPKFDFYIAKDIYQDGCIAKIMNEDLASCPQSKAHILDFPQISARWKKGEVKAQLIYLESENPEELFWDFKNVIDNDLEIKKVYYRLQYSSNREQNNLMIKEINRKIMNQLVFFPLYDGEVNFIINKKYSLTLGHKSIIRVEIARYVR